MKFEVDFTGKKYQTRDGRPAKIYELLPDGRMLGARQLYYGTWVPCDWTSTGSLLGGSGSKNDLIPVPQKVTLKECWVTYRPDGTRSCSWSREINAIKNKPDGGHIRHIPAMEVDANE